MSAMCVAVQIHEVPVDAAAVEALSARHLDSSEIALLSPRSGPKRRAEFVVGRVAARTAVCRLLGCPPSPSSFLVLHEGEGPTGRPVVVLAHGGNAPYVSISHVDGLAVAAASFAKIGIDLATIQTQEQSFIDDAFAPEELTRWAEWLACERTSPLAVTTAFAAKESALKWLGTGFGRPLRSIEVLPAAVGLDEDPASFPVPTSIFPITLVEHGNDCSSLLSGRFARIGDKVAVLLSE